VTALPGGSPLMPSFRCSPRTRTYQSLGAEVVGCRGLQRSECTQVAVSGGIGGNGLKNRRLSPFSFGCWMPLPHAQNEHSAVLLRPVDFTHPRRWRQLVAPPCARACSAGLVRKFHPAGVPFQIPGRGVHWGFPFRPELRVGRVLVNPNRGDLISNFHCPKSKYANGPSTTARKARER
jgi:hypothetical protein